MSHILFISDLHLQESEPLRTKSFLDFLQNTASQAKALYILGDLFEVWIGDDVNTEFNITVQSALKKLVASGVPVYLMRGNRDFLLGKKFAELSVCTIITEDPTKIYLYGKTTLLTHGDVLCTHDRLLMWFRKYAHNPKLNRYFLLLPVFMRRFLAEIIRAKSKRSDKTKGVDMTAIINFMQRFRVEQLIHGHSHQATMSKIKVPNIGKCRYITLGAWDALPRYLIYYEDHNIKVV